MTSKFTPSTNASGYCVAADPVNPRVWFTDREDNVFYYNVNNTNCYGPFFGGANGNNADGLVVDGKGEVWVARATWGDDGFVTSISHLNTNGVLIGAINLSTNDDPGFSGIAVDCNSNIWVACQNSNCLLRINPGIGAVDMNVGLGDDAQPFNYGDMTGANIRVVNPSMMPLRGTWDFIQDSGVTNEQWSQMTWTETNMSNCTVDIYARASNDRGMLFSQPFVQATNVTATNGTFWGVQGRYAEFRVALTRDTTNDNPQLSNFQLWCNDYTFTNNEHLNDVTALAGSDAVFTISNLSPTETYTYQWYIQYPWTNQWLMLPDETNTTFTITNVDSWVDNTQVKVLVYNALGQYKWFGPATLHVTNNAITFTNDTASSYPATINVCGLENLDYFFYNIQVTLKGLTCSCPSNLNILLVPPKEVWYNPILLMSAAGGTQPVTNATLVFTSDAINPIGFEYDNPIISGGTIYCLETHGANSIGNMPGYEEPEGPPEGPYQNGSIGEYIYYPNGAWQLYIYGTNNCTGSLDGWSLEFEETSW